jgi:hypothetical protein
MRARLGLFKRKRGGLSSKTPPARDWEGLEWGPEGWGAACLGRAGAVSGLLTAALGAVPCLLPGFLFSPRPLRPAAVGPGRQPPPAVRSAGESSR